MADVRINSPDWSVQRTRPHITRGGTRGAADAQAGFPAEFLTTDSEVAEELTARPKAATRARGAAPGPLDVSYDLGPGEAAVLAVRHPSKALTFHRPVQATTSRARGGPSQVRFVVHVPSVARPAATRGPVTQAAKAFIIKIAGKVGDKIASLVLSKLVAHVEASSWKRKGLREGWLKVTKETLAARKLEAGRPSSTEQSLLLIHGTFSNAASAYRSLADSSFFQRVRPLYGDRIYAFDHFTLSRTPEENVHMLLEELPNQTFTFDVITHSRGGLVLRNLAERSASFGPLAKRFKLGRAVLVASPNEGTPLATPGRWESTVGWMANLLELFPDNPFTTGAEFVANGLVWIARHASGDLPGLRSMDGDGDLVAELQQPPGPPADAYSALVANYNPSEKVLMRMVDAGVDQFFGSANDLVVPSEGGWRIDREGASFIPGSRIGCFGPGGNLPGDEVTHIGFFSEKASVDFLVTALAGEAHKLPPVDPAGSLPDRRLLRSGAPGVSTPPRVSGGRRAAARRDRFGEPARPDSDTSKAGADGPRLRLTVVNGDLTFERLPLLIGHYNATKLTGTERVMNNLIGGAMAQALELGDYPIEAGTHQVFVNRRIAKGKLTPRPKAVIVVGLGQEGSLRGAELSHTVCQAVIAWARHVVETSDADGPAPAPLELAATLIGSGGTGIATGQAAQLVAQGVQDANERLRDASGSNDRRWPLVDHLRLVELYLDRASEAWRALRMHEEATPTRYTLDPVIERGTGPLPRPLDAGYRGAEYDFITAGTRTMPSGEVEIGYALDTRRARAEIRTVSPQGTLLRNLIKTASSDANDDPQIGSTLFKLLIPVELESFLAGSTDMQIELDDGTAGIPWELLDDQKQPNNPWAIRTKLLRKLRLQSFRSNPRDAGGDAHALVIGAPQCPDAYAPLPGAWEEARGVFDRLSGDGGLGSACVTKLMADDPGDVGADARTVLNALFERDWRVVHIAGHGALPETDGSLGGVVLSDDCFLGPSEIRAMRVVPELVFINCCHLGAAPVASVLVAGEPNPSVYDRARFASSVARELISIGVRCVIAAGWAVDDGAAKTFASTFYGCLLEGDRFIDAVARARSAAHDYEGNTWAAYQCYGDPDWRLRRPTSESFEPPEDEFEGVTSVAALKLALETLLVQKTYQGFDSSYQRKRLVKLTDIYRKAKWSASDGVAESFAKVCAALNDLDAAIAWYDEAIAVADGKVSLRALEQRTNLEVRRAWSALQPAPSNGKRKKKSASPAKTAVATARDTIRKATKLLDELMTFRPTSERANLGGSAMKRLALIEAAAGRPREELRAIDQMKRYYKRAEELCAQDGLANRFYPASNYIAAELALNAGKKGWKLADRALFAAIRQSLAAQNADDPDFWSIVGDIEVDLYEAVEGAELATAQPLLEKRYQDLHARMRGGTDWGSVYDTAAFVLAKYRARATSTEQHAVDLVLAQLRGFGSPPPGSDGRAGRRVARR